jgi:hypothetical protein
LLIADLIVVSGIIALPFDEFARDRRGVPADELLLELVTELIKEAERSDCGAKSVAEFDLE